MKIAKRRRRENKTDYLRRLKLLKANKPRMVFRKTNRYLLAQYVISADAKDKILFGFTSKILLKKDWTEKFKGSLKSLPASYLLGYLFAKEILKKKLEKPIADFGMMRVLHKTKIFAFLKGVLDAGIEISCPEEAFPSKERIEGKNLKIDFRKSFNEIKLKIGNN